MLDDGIQSRQVETAMEGGEEWHAETGYQRNMRPIQVTVDYVEIGGALGDSFQQRGLGNRWIAARPGPRRSAFGQTDTSVPRVDKSALANSVT